MRKSIIVAASQNGVIGKDGQLPWKLLSDLRRFKELTMGHICVMGRKTYESLPPKLRPLPGRTTIGLTRLSPLSLFKERLGFDWCHSLNDAINLALMNVAETELFVCGGGEVYREALPIVDRVYLTVVDRDFKGDTYFPFYDNLGRYVPGEKVLNGSGRWRLESREDVDGELPHSFEIWDRVR